MKLKDIIKKYYNPQPEIWDKEDMWIRIEGNLPKKEKKNRLFFWFFIGALGLLSMSLFFLNPDSQNELVNIEIKDQRAPNVSNGNVVGANSDQLEDLNKSKSLGEDKLENSSVQGLNIEKNLNEKLEKEYSIIANQKNTKDTKSNPIIYKPKPEEQSEDFKWQRNDDKHFLIGPISSTSSNTEANNNRSKKGKVENDKENVSLTTKSLINMAMLTIPSLHIPLEMREFDVLSLTPEEKIKDTDNHANPNRWAFAIAPMVSTPTSSIKSLNPINEAFVGLHQNSKSNLASLGIEAMLNYEVANNLVFGVGIDYQRVAEHYHSVITETDIKIIPTDSARYFVVNNIKEYVSGELIETTTSNFSIKTPNYRHYLNIPLLIGYKVRLNKLRIFPTASFNFNILHKLEGRSYLTNLKISDYNDSKIDQLYKGSNVHSASFAINFDYPFGDKYLLGAGVFHRRQINSSFLGDVGVDERYHLTGLKINFIYKLD